MTRKKVFAFHLLNDFSGSPKVLSQLLKGWIKNDIETHVCSSLENKGFLSDIEGVQYHNNVYSFFKFIPLRVLALLLNQLLLILKMYSRVDRDSVVYINTVLPFGAAILGKMKGCKVVYHIHETSIKPEIFKKFLFGIVQWAATETIYVSNYLALQEKSKVESSIIYNAIEDEFLEKAQGLNRSNRKKDRVLMICSLKKYKGVLEYLDLASNSPKFQFKLVLNASQTEINTFFYSLELPNNLTVYPVQKDVHVFYQWADVVLNLSRPDSWVETFGLTAIEAMAYGLPTIVPPVGGIAEIVHDSIHGYHVDSRNSQVLKQKLMTLLTDSNLYDTISRNVRERVLCFSEQNFIKQALIVLQ